MLEAIFFDFDGTISPTSKRQEEWFKFYSARNNVSWKFKTFEEFLCVYNKELHKEGGVQNFYDYMRLLCDIKDKKHPVLPAYEELVSQNPAKLYCGMKKTIKEIWKLGCLGKDTRANRRMRLGINTTNTWKNCYRDLEKNGLLQYFDCFITEEVLNMYYGDNNGDALKKPSTISVSLMLAQLGSVGAQTLHIGDTLNDLRASNKVVRLNPLNPESVITVGACYGYEGRPTLENGVEIAGEKVHFDYLIDKPVELIGIVEELRRS